MDNFLQSEIKDMTKAQLEEMLRKLRESRKKGYTISPKSRRSTNPFADLDPDVAEQILKELMEKKTND